MAKIYKIYCITNNSLGGIYYSSDSGQTWSSQSSGYQWLFDIVASSNGTNLAISSTIASTRGVSPLYTYTSTNNGLILKKNILSDSWQGIAGTPDCSKLVVYTSSMDSSNKIYTSDNFGSTWKIKSTKILNISGIAMSSDANTIVCSTGLTNPTNIGGYIYISTDFGTIWTQLQFSPKLPWTSITMSRDGTKIFACANNDYIWSSSDSGKTWISHAFKSSWSCISSSTDGTKIAACSNSGHIYLSGDSGITWTQSTDSKLSIGNKYWTKIKISSDGKFIAAINYYDLKLVYSSMDFGLSWSAVPIDTKSIAVCNIAIVPDQ